MRVRAAMVLLSQMLKLWEQLRVLRDTEEKARRAGMSREEALKAEANDLFKVWNHVEVSASVWAHLLVSRLLASRMLSRSTPRP